MSIISNLQKYIAATAESSTKNWNFPKMHLRNHVFDDIIQKGSLQNYDSLYNEPLHGSIKDSYQMRTNFKEIESQVSPCYLFSLKAKT